MKNLYLGIYLLLFTCFAHGQDYTTKRYNPYHHWLIKMPMLTMADPASPNLQLAIEHRFDKYNAAVIQSGFSFALDEKENCCKDINGIRLKANYTRYLITKKYLSFFNAAEIFYTQYSDPFRGYFINSANNEYFDYYTLHRTLYGLNLKAGLRLSRGRLIFDVYAGIGIKYRIVTHTDRDYPGDELSRPFHPNLWYSIEKPRNDVTFSLPLNIALGYILP